MRARRVRPLLAAAAVVAVLSYGLSDHDFHHMGGHDGIAGAAVCLLFATALAFARAPAPSAAHTRLLPRAWANGAATAPRTAIDARARASPSALQRFRN